MSERRKVIVEAPAEGLKCYDCPSADFKGGELVCDHGWTLSDCLANSAQVEAMEEVWKLVKRQAALYKGSEEMQSMPMQIAFKVISKQEAGDEH